MTTNQDTCLSRRDLMKTTGKVAAASALAGMTVPFVHAGENNTIQVALVGCGGRGTGAAANALSTRQGPTRLVAMADVFRDRLTDSHRRLERTHAKQMEVPEGKRFIGFDAYQRAMDALRPGDVVILTTPPAFRWVHFGYAIQKRLNVFMEKPLTVDGASSRRLLELNGSAEKQNLKVGVGLMCRHCDARRELFDRIKKGAIGDLTLLRAYRMHGPVGFFASPPKPNGISELMYQVQRFHSFLWASGGCFSDFYIHNIDECCWMKDAWPVKAQASGGRHYRGDSIDQNFDSYSVEYTFADGAKLFLEGRCMQGCHSQFASYAHGTRGSAIISGNNHVPAKSRLFRDQNIIQPPTQGLGQVSKNEIWRFERNEPNPYQQEWEHLMEAIRRDRPYNEVVRGVEASLVTAMGRMAAHTGRVVTREQCLTHNHDLTAGIDKLTMESPPPLRAGKDGKYPVQQPGIETTREF
jgi:predicted dehydrogenase